MTGRNARRVLAVAALSVAGAGLWAVPALAAPSADGEPEKPACAESAPNRSPLAALLGGRTDDEGARQSCNSQRSHVDRSGAADASDASDASDADATGPADAIGPADATGPAGATDAAGRPAS